MFKFNLSYLTTFNLLVVKSFNIFVDPNLPHIYKTPKLQIDLIDKCVSPLAEFD